MYGISSFALLWALDELRYDGFYFVKKFPVMHVAIGKMGMFVIGKRLWKMVLAIKTGLPAECKDEKNMDYQ